MAYFKSIPKLKTTLGSLDFGTIDYSSGDDVVLYLTGNTDWDNSNTAKNNEYGIGFVGYDVTNQIKSAMIACKNSGANYTITLLTLSNGNYVKATFDYSATQQTSHVGGWHWSLCTSEDVILVSGGVSGGWWTTDNNDAVENLKKFYFMFFEQSNSYYSERTHNAGAVLQFQRTWASGQPLINRIECGNSGFSTTIWENFINGAIPPEYEWTAWDLLGGNNGQYRCNLTQIKDSSIGDFSGVVTGGANDFDLISGQSDIWGIFQNMSYGEERTIAWSGNAYMTFKITAESQMPSYANFIFKFYSNQGTLLLTRAELVRWTGTGDDVVIGFYLSFVYDEDNQAALFCPVIKMINGTTYKWGYNNLYDDTEMLNMWQWLHMSTAGEDDRPYDTGTTDNGGNPEGDILTNDDITNVNVPSLSALQTGMLTVYVPDDTELQHIASYLWSDNVIDNFKKYFNNFSDNIISLYVLPYKPSSLPNKPFKVGGLESDDLELASVDYITNRFVNIDMGEIDVGGLWNSYLDFSPYTKFNVYLPGIGVQAIDADDIMAPLDKNKNFGSKPGSKLKLDYVMDLMTGILVAYLKVNGQIRYQFSGKIGYQIPITGENYNNVVHAFTVAASGFVTTLASGGQTAPFALGAVAAAAINFNKPDVYRGGNLSGSASSMSYKHPYLIRRVPNKPQLVNQDKFTGFPTYKSGKLKDFGGYTEVVEVHAEGFVCTEEEREEIIELLKKGVIL